MPGILHHARGVTGIRRLRHLWFGVVHKAAKPWLTRFDLAWFQDDGQKRRLRRYARENEHRWAAARLLFRAAFVVVYFPLCWAMGCALGVFGVFIDKCFHGGWLALILAVVSVIASLRTLLLIPNWFLDFLISPKYLIINYLLLAFYSAQSGDTWTVSKSKRGLLRHIERVAKAFENGLPASIPAADSVTQQWWRLRAGRMAAEFRKLKCWVLTPMAMTAGDLSRKLLFYLENVTAGTWDVLPHSEEPTVPVSIRLVYRIRLFAVGLVLLLAAWVLCVRGPESARPIMLPISLLLALLGIERLLSTINPGNSPSFDLKMILDVLKTSNK